MKYLVVLIISCWYLVAFGQDSLNMVSLAQYNPPNMPTTPQGYKYNDIWAWEDAVGNEFAILGSADSIHFFNVTECSAPEYLFGFKGGATTIWRDFKVYNGYAYAVTDSGGEGLHVFNVSDAANGNISHVLTTTSFFTNSHNIFVNESTARLYVYGNLPGGDDLRILSLANPANPTMIYSDNLNSVKGGNDNLYIHDGQVINDTLYASHIYIDEFYVYDFTDVNNPVFLKSAPSGDITHSSWNDSQNEYAYICREGTGYPIMVVDLQNLDDPINDIYVATDFQHPNDPSGGAILAHNPFVRGDYLYVSYYEDGTKVYDITDRLNPTVLAYYEMNETTNGGNWGTYPFLSSGCIVSSDMHKGLFTLQVDYGLTDTCTPMVDVDDANIPSDTYVASNHLWSENLVDVGSNVTFQADFSVTLEPGFEVKVGAEFLGKIENCVSAN